VLRADDDLSRCRWLDFRRIFAAASSSGMRHFFVKNDAAPQTASSLADIETSYKNLRQMLA
jgi:hypothetical protein